MDRWLPASRSRRLQSIKEWLIELDFQLAKDGPDGKQQIVGDSDKVDLREFKTFFATASDDNSWRPCQP